VLTFARVAHPIWDIINAYKDTRKIVEKFFCFFLLVGSENLKGMVNMRPTIAGTNASILLV
jgi:hypothetical protein